MKKLAPRLMYSVLLGSFLFSILGCASIIRETEVRFPES
jgi:hypothetical protein